MQNLDADYQAWWWLGGNSSLPGTDPRHPLCRQHGDSGRRCGGGANRLWTPTRSGVSEQITYLSALDHLSPTHVYGVTFERAWLRRPQRVHLGTASTIGTGDPASGDVVRQLERTLENVEALLSRPVEAVDMGCFWCTCGIGRTWEWRRWQCGSVLAMCRWQ